jgi:hypothetical protein
MTPISASWPVRASSPDEARRERPYGHPGQQVADQRGQAQLAGEETAREGEDQAHDDGGDERGLVRHGRFRCVERICCVGGS